MRFDCFAIYALVGTAFVSTAIAVEPRLTFSKRVFGDEDLSATKLAGQAITTANSQAATLASLIYQLSNDLDKVTNSKKPETAASLPVSGTPVSESAPAKPATSPKKETSPQEASPEKEEEKDDETT